MEDIYLEVNKQRGKVTEIWMERMNSAPTLLICYYCHECGTFGRSNSPKEGKHTISKFMLRKDVYKEIKKDLPLSTEHGSGWYMTKEDLESKIFDLAL